MSTKHICIYSVLLLIGDVVGLTASSSSCFDFAAMMEHLSNVRIIHYYFYCYYYIQYYPLD